MLATRAQLAQTLHVSRARIAQYCTAGLPSLTNDGFDPRDACEWVVASLEPRAGCVAINHARRWLAQRQPDELTGAEIAMLRCALNDAR